MINIQFHLDFIGTLIIGGDEMLFLMLFVCLLITSCNNPNVKHMDIFSGKDSSYIFDNNYDISNISSHNGGVVFHFNDGKIVGVYERGNNIYYVEGESGSRHYNLVDYANEFDSIYGVNVNYIIRILEFFRKEGIRYINFNPNIIKKNYQTDAFYKRCSDEE